MMKDFSMHLLDIVQNSLRAGASRIEIVLEENTAKNQFSFSVTDNGCGMDEELLSSVRDPFRTSRTTRRVGLGIPMLSQTATLCKGNLEIKSAPKQGTMIQAVMELNHIDRPPLGDLAEAVYILITTNPKIRFRYAHTYDQKTFLLDTDELLEVLSEVPLNTPSVAAWIRETLQEGIMSIRPPY